MRTADWYEQWGESLQRVIDAATKRDRQKRGTPQWENAEAEYQAALAQYRELASQIKR
jgi:hypothetical protein